MPDYTIAGYDRSDVVIHSGADPFNDFNSANSAAIGTVFSVSANPDLIVVRDNDLFFDETDLNQEVDLNTSQNGGTATAGTDIDPEYIYVVRPVGGTPADDFYIYAYEMGIGPGADGFVTEYRLTPGQQYTIIAEGPTNDPSVAYSSLYVCFTAGTMIETPAGERPIEDLTPGDLVRTVDGRFVPVKWKGSRDLRFDDLMSHPENRPVRIEAGALGPDMPTNRLTVSPQHRIMLRSKIAERMFGEAEVLVPAQYFIGLPGVTRVPDVRPTQYIHLLVEGHQVLTANGTPAESLYVGKEARKMLGKDNWRALKATLKTAPFQQGKPTMQPARPLIDGKEARRLVNRHVRNHSRNLVEKHARPKLTVVR